MTGNYTADTQDPNTFAVTKGQAISHSSGDAMKSETSARIFLNGELEGGSTAHIELRPVYDSEAANNDYEAHQNYTQQDFLREAYIDTTTADGTYVRIGKQQIVWGKADGAKFLDLINPTDYREMAQNAMDESRITVWGINAEKILDNGMTVQGIVTLPRENIFAGLNRNIDSSVKRTTLAAQWTDQTLNNGTDEGHSFILLGPDTITGRHNGFLNIVPDMGGVAGMFANGFGGQGALVDFNADNTVDNAFLGYRVGTTTADFGGMTMAMMAGALGRADALALPANFVTAIRNVAAQINGVAPGAVNAAQAGAVTGAQMLEMGFGVMFNTNLADYELGAGFAAGTQIQDSAFDYMAGASFVTFDAFEGAASQYVYDMPDDKDVDLGLKMSNSLSNGLNYSLAYSYNYDKNPIINLSWRDSNGGLIHAHRVKTDGANGFTSAEADAVAATQAVVLSNSATDIGTQYSGNAGVQNYGGFAMNAAGDQSLYGTLRFTQTVERVHNIGSAFDYALDTESLGPVVLRGEFVYTKDGYQPVIDKDLLNIGHLSAALTMQKADRFKYVLGADVTVLTDMMLSGQFIQERNLDYVDGANRYTASYASMSMLNNFQKDIENKEFYSLFASKPFGESGEGRWNNILMLEEGGGRWNRFDVEYSLSNDVIGTFEVNKYWGDANSQFGQLENSSNVQVGLKYIIE